MIEDTADWKNGRFNNSNVDFAESADKSRRRAVIQLFIKKLNEHEQHSAMVNNVRVTEQSEYAKGVVDGYKQRTVVLLNLLDKACLAEGLGRIEGHRVTIETTQWELKD